MPAARSKEGLQFKNKIDAFREDLEFIDVLCIANMKDNLLPHDHLLFHYLKKRHEILGKRSIGRQSRKIVVTHLRKTVYSSYIKDLYEELTIYLKALVFRCAMISKDKDSAHKLVGEHHIKINANDILQYATLNDLIQKISMDIVRSLENERSTKSLIEKICKRIGIQISSSIIEEAILFLELRHLLVHADGKADSEFRGKYDCFRYEKGNRIKLTYDIILEATIKVSNLVFAIDEAAIKKGILKPNTQ